MIEEIKDSPQARIVENHLLALLGGFTTCVQLCFQGAIAGSEFLNYAVDKLYFGLEIYFGGGSINAGITNVTFYDQANAINLYINDVAAYWDVTAAASRFASNSPLLHNIFFSRIVSLTYTHIKFIGYKITY